MSRWLHFSILIVTIISETEININYIIIFHFYLNSIQFYCEHFNVHNKIELNQNLHNVV